MTDPGKFSKIASLSAREWFLYFCALFTLPLVKFLLKQRGFGKTEKFLSGYGRKRRETGNEDRVRSAARMVSIAAQNGFYKAQCLEQAITLWWMLHLMGIESTIRLGIYKNDTGVEAHAWVIHEDKVVLGETAELDSYEPILDVNVNRQ